MLLEVEEPKASRLIALIKFVYALADHVSSDGEIITQTLLHKIHIINLPYVCVVL